MREMITLSSHQVLNAYARWAPVYDIVFKAILGPGRKAMAHAASQSAGRLLNIGVGTGLELPLFSSHMQVTGIDLSEPMLEVAQKRVKKQKLANVEGLLQMDAMDLSFPDGHFDVAVAPYVLTVVPHPEKMLDEMHRVVRPGGEMILVNHIAAEKGPRARMEKWLARRSASLGWHPTFSWHVIEAWMAKNPHIQLLERKEVSPFGLFTLIRLKRGI